MFLYQKTHQTFISKVMVFGSRRGVSHPKCRVDFSLALEGRYFS